MAAICFAGGSDRGGLIMRWRCGCTNITRSCLYELDSFFPDFVLHEGDVGRVDWLGVMVDGDGDGF